LSKLVAFRFIYLILMAQPKSFGPECVYGKPCYAICKNPNCRKPGLICEPGFHDKD